METTPPDVRRIPSSPNIPPQRPDFQAPFQPIGLLEFVRTCYRQKLVAARKSEETLAKYVRICESLERFWRRWPGNQDLPLAALDNVLLTAYLAALSEAGSQAATINDHRAVIVAVWNYARKPRFRQYGLTDADPPDVDRIHAEQEDPRCWTVEEISRLLEAAAARPGRVGRVLAGDWWPALILTVYDSGLRINAAMHLPAWAVDLETGWLTVDSRFQKQRRGQSFQLDPQTLLAIRSIEPGHEGNQRLFPWPLDRRKDGEWNGEWKSLRAHFKRILLSAGLITRGQPTRKDLFHKIRKTTGTYITAGADEAAAVKHLGHSGVAVTRRYQDPRLLPQSSAVHVLPRPSFRRQLKLFEFAPADAG